MNRLAPLAVLLCVSSSTAARGDEPAPKRYTEVSIVGDQFFINGKPTYEGRTWNGHRIEGLLFNSRMVQGVFDDANPSTVKRWAYPDTGKWDADRNTREFVAAMPDWRRHGLLAFTDGELLRRRLELGDVGPGHDDALDATAFGSVGKNAPCHPPAVRRSKLPRQGGELVEHLTRVLH